MPEPTVAQRIVRAKRTLAKAKVPFEVPRGPELAARLGSVLEVVYLIFNEGYAATAGDDWMRPALCEEALRLGRILAGLAPREPEVHGLVALMELQASRLHGADRPGRRADPAAGPGPRAAGTGCSSAAASPRSHGPRPWAVRAGPYALQAAIAACHARAAPGRGHRLGPGSPRSTACSRRVAASPVVELNRAVAVGMAYGPAAGLALVDDARGASRALAAATTCCPACAATCSPSWAGTTRLAREFERAASLTRNASEQSIPAPARAPAP